MGSRGFGPDWGVRFTTGTIRLELDRRHVTLPRLGTLKTAESTRKLARHLERGTGPQGHGCLICAHV
jgi:hypothetical protein